MTLSTKPGLPTTKPGHATTKPGYATTKPGNSTVAAAPGALDMSMTGGRKRRGRRSARRHGKKGGMGCGAHSKKEKKGGMGCGSHKKKKTQKGGLSAVLATPFLLLGLQKFFQTRKGRKDLKKAAKTARKTVRSVRRTARRL